MIFKINIKNIMDIILDLLEKYSIENIKYDMELCLISSITTLHYNEDVDNFIHYRSNKIIDSMSNNNIDTSLENYCHDVPLDNIIRSIWPSIGYDDNKYIISLINYIYYNLGKNIFPKLLGKIIKISFSHDFIYITDIENIIEYRYNEVKDFIILNDIKI